MSMITAAMESPQSEETTTKLTAKVRTSDNTLHLGRSDTEKSSTGKPLLRKPAFPISSNLDTTRSNSQGFEQFTVDAVDDPSSLDDTVLNTSIEFANEDDSLDHIDTCPVQMGVMAKNDFQELDLSIQDEMRRIEQAKCNIRSIIVEQVQQIDQAFPICEQRYITELESFDKRLQNYKQSIMESLGVNSSTESLIKHINRLQMQINSKLRLCQQTEKFEKDFKDLSIQCAMPQLEQANSVIMSKLREKLHQLEQQFPNGEQHYKAELESMQQALQEYIHNIESLGQNTKTEYLVQLQMPIRKKRRFCQKTEEIRRLEKYKERIQEKVGKKEWNTIEAVKNFFRPRKTRA